MAVLFVYGDLVTLECGNTGSFKAGGACTDDNDVLGVVGLFDLERSLLAYLGVDRAGDLGTAVPDTADAVLVAAQAGTYILAVACKQLVGDIGVGDERTAEIDEAARNRIELIVRSLAEQNGVTEKLKAENQMEWVRQMNACKAQAEEIVKAELIYG